MLAIVAPVLAVLATAAPPPETNRSEVRNLRAGVTAETPLIATKSTGKTRVVYLVHTGPYWKLGPIFTRLGEHMRRDGQTGPMFARFSADPRLAPAATLRSEAGFIADNRYEETPPFTVDERESEFVAYIVVEGPRSATFQHYRRLREWIAQSGYEELGPITEYYYPEDRATVTEPRTEIQFVLKQVVPAFPDDPAPPASKSDEVDPIATKLVEEPPVRAASDSTIPAPAAEEADSTPEANSRISEPQPPAAPMAKRDGQVVSAEHELSAPPAELAMRTVKLPKDENAGCVITPEEKPDSDPDDSPEAAEDARLLPVERLISERRFEQLAVQLMPDGSEIPEDLRVWFGHVVFRIRAVARGIEQVYPGDHEAASGLAEAILSRYESKMGDAARDPLLHPFVSLDPGRDKAAGAKQAILNQLDRLLARIALRSVSAGAATDELTPIVERMKRVVRPSTE